MWDDVDTQEVDVLLYGEPIEEEEYWLGEKPLDEVIK
jgi:hypothetical protein